MCILRSLIRNNCCCRTNGRTQMKYVDAGGRNSCQRDCTCFGNCGCYHRFGCEENRYYTADGGCCN